MQPSSARCQCHIQDLRRDEPLSTRAWQRCVRPAQSQYRPCSIGDPCTAAIYANLRQAHRAPLHRLEIHYYPLHNGAMPEIRSTLLGALCRSRFVQGEWTRRDSLVFLGRKPVPLHTGQVFLFFFFFNTNPLCRHFQQQGPLSTPSPCSVPSSRFDHPGASSKVLLLAITNAESSKCMNGAHLLT